MEIVETITTPNYIKIRLDRESNRNKEIEYWCNDCSCGKRVSIHHFAFKTEKELAWFKLKWMGK
jgi:hypothetical protein